MEHLIQTVLGPLAPDALGRTDVHEHLFLRSPAMPGDEFDDLNRMVTEVKAVQESGIDCVVELTPIGLGRDARKMAELSRRTGLHVVGSTGFHRDAHYPEGHWVYREPAEELLRVMLTDLREGMDARDWQGPTPSGTEVKAGVIKLGASYQTISAPERNRLEVGAEAARLTGVSVIVHCEVGTMAPQIVDALAAGGLSTDRVLLAHMDRNPDPELHVSLAERGANLIYDTVGRVKYRPESALLDLIADLVERGHQDRLLLGTDVGRRSMLTSYGGGPGMDVLGREFLPRLARRIGNDAVDAIVRANPARALARVAAASS